MLKNIFIILVAIFISGCAGIHTSGTETLLSRPAPEVCTTPGQEGRRAVFSTRDLSKIDKILEIREFLKDQKKHEVPMVNTLDEILDCVIGKINSAVVNDNKEIELKLYRGYVALAIISRYAAFNYTGVVGSNINVDFQAYPELSDDAAAMLARIENADRALRFPLQVLNKNNPDYNPALIPTGTPIDFKESGVYYKDLQTVYKVDKILTVMVAAIASERPTYKRAKSFLFNLIKAIPSKMLNTDDIVQTGTSIIGKSLTLKAFGNAYITDSRSHIESLTDVPTFENWKMWNDLIVDSCNRLANISNTTHHCESINDPDN